MLVDYDARIESAAAAAEQAMELAQRAAASAEQALATADAASAGSYRNVGSHRCA